MNLSGKTALVTGGAVRVGKAIALMLAQNGANVIINYFSSDTSARETAKEIEDFGVSALTIQADVSKYDDVTRMVMQANDQFGGIDVLINSASLFKGTEFPTDDVSVWHQVTRILIDGSFYCTNAVAPYMLGQQTGIIINMVDLSAWIPAKGMIAHSVGKSALLAMTRQLAVELAPNIRVNAVAPGPVLPPPDYSEAESQATANSTLLKRWGTPQDVTQAIKFLIEADYITGEFITVDGGERYGTREFWDGS